MSTTKATIPAPAIFAAAISTGMKSERTVTLVNPSQLTYPIPDSELSTPISEGTTEAEVQTRLERIFGGGHAQCKLGIADIFNGEVLVEIKDVKHWSDGIGQLMRYNRCLRAKKRILYLFGSIPSSTLWEEIKDTCSDAGIEAMRDDLHYRDLLAEYRAESRQSRGDPTIIIDERDERTMLTMQDQRERQQRALAQLAASTTAIRRQGEIADRQVASELDRLYAKCESSLHELQDYLRNLNDTRLAAQGFINERIQFAAGERVSSTKVIDQVKKWLASRGIQGFTKYFEQITELLTSGGATRGHHSGKMCWLGIRLSQAPASPSFQEDDEESTA